eukprot:1193109-Rhodomonas_salina.1
MGWGVGGGLNKSVQTLRFLRRMRLAALSIDSTWPRLLSFNLSPPPKQKHKLRLGLHKSTAHSHGACFQTVFAVTRYQYLAELLPTLSVAALPHAVCSCSYAFARYGRRSTMARCRTKVSHTLSNTLAVLVPRDRTR